ncbi:hypothetical protein L873DRAFT_1800400 [Choiromyces venosus 120613-1]|uniref:Uncharacterized protein n=1 Tax=Choiromyces venosus 120613-1 TaxID=1336337 RepID=A0A3N4K3E0_9PEZI|nr:hypothetical protein L873DRAFT_1800400 [Choiromyces venosus 120613-1]
MPVSRPDSAKTQLDYSNPLIYCGFTSLSSRLIPCHRGMEFVCGVAIVALCYTKWQVNFYSLPY